MRTIHLFLLAGLLINTLNCFSQTPSKQLGTWNADTVTTVYYPLVNNNDTRIFDWAINRTQYGYGGSVISFHKLYLNSLNCRYRFFVPTDAFFANFIDPIAFGQDAPQGGLQFKYNTTTGKVYAVVRTFNKNSFPYTFSDSVKVITDETFLQDRLWKLLDQHIVVGDVVNGRSFYVTRGNDLIKINGTGTGLSVAGGYELHTNSPCKAIQEFKQTNGYTYLMDKPLQPALRSVYKILSETPAFSGFFNLLVGIPDTCVQKIFFPQGVDYAVSMFHAFRYTVYVPTNASMQAALDQGIIKNWSAIGMLTNDTQKAIEINKLIRFLKYHFQDEAVFFGQNADGIYQTATIKNDVADTHFHSGKNRFYKIGVHADASSMTLTTESNRTAHVVTTDGLYNLIAKDYLFSKTPSNFKNVDGTGPSIGLAFTTSSILTSSSAVIHQIDEVLTFQ